MQQPSSPFGFPKNVPCSKLLLKWFNQINTFLFNRLNQGKILPSEIQRFLGPAPPQRTEPAKENKIKIRFLTGMMFLKQMVIISDFPFIALFSLLFLITLPDL